MTALKNRYVIIALLIHVVIMFGLFIGLIATGQDYPRIMLRGDSYYEIAQQFANGDTLMHKFRGPILPLIFSVLFVFPQSVQPLIRLLISLGFSIGTILLLFYITKNFLSDKEFLYGSLIFILNPVYIHWIIKPYPEICLAFLLGLFIFYITKYLNTHRTKYVLCAVLVFTISFFIKPVFIFIPVLLFIAAIFIKSKKIGATTIILIFSGIIAYVAEDNFTEIKYKQDVNKCDRKYEYINQTLLIFNTYWVDYVVRTKQFYKPTIHQYRIAYREGKSLDDYTYDWIKKFYQKYPEGNLIFMNLYFIYSEPLLVLQKLLMSPLFYFAMSARQIETYAKLVFSIFSVVLAIIGLKALFKNSKNKNGMILIISIIIGYISLHLATHAVNRYSVPILPYLYIWGGIPLSKFKKKLLRLGSKY
jgi:hypothetical protein